MRILITGADGMLGSNLVRLLLERGHQVSVLIHPSSRSTTLEGLDIRKYMGDVLQPETFDIALSENEAVIHAAASTNLWPSRSEMVRKINIQGTQNMINGVLKHHSKLMIYIGSASSVNIADTSPGKYAFPGAKYRLDYIDSKYEALNLVIDAVKTQGLPAFAILPSFMIGPYDSLPGSGKMILALAQRKLKYYTNGGRNFIHVKDVSLAIANSLEIGRVGSVYIAANENISYQAFFKKVAKIISQPEPKIYVPDWLVKTIGLFGSLGGIILKKEPLLTYPIARISCDNQFVSAEDSTKELKMPQTNIEIAIQDCYDWFIENSYLKQ